MSIFSHVENQHVKSNTFDLSHEKKMSLKMGRLVPTLCLEVVPGDKFNIHSSQLVRFAPMLAPMMHQVSVYQHFFFVPNRLLWPNWENFITGGEDGLDASVFPTVRIQATDIQVGCIGDYLGLPIADIAEYDVSAIPVAAYNKIWNDYYRDQNLQEKRVESLVDGDNPTILSTYLIEPLNRAWQHDYFTSALPWTQKGAEVQIPIGEDAPLLFHPEGKQYAWSSAYGPGVIPNQNPLTMKTAADGETERTADANTVLFDVSGSHTVDLSAATMATINELRRAFKLQEWLEKNARGGSRYIESILSHFGVRSSDKRLQRPEFLGGSSTPVSISEVLQTSDAAAEDTPQGNMAGHGISVGGSRGISYYAEEHGYIIGIMSIMPKSAYYQGIAKHFRKFDRFDYYWPSFARIGEQPIYNYELYANLDDNEEFNGIFGYTPRYAEYKYVPSSVHGTFRSSLDFWHMGRKFDALPLLNDSFIKCEPTTRIFAVEQTEQIYAHIYNGVKASRKMPYFGTPTL